MCADCACTCAHLEGSNIKGAGYIFGPWAVSVAHRQGFVNARFGLRFQPIAATLIVCPLSTCGLSRNKAASCIYGIGMSVTLCGTS
jgi:hypothetical protein